MDPCTTAITLFQTTSPCLARFHGVDAGSLAPLHKVVDAENVW